MNKKPKQPAAEKSSCQCLCQEIGPALTEFLRRLGPPAEAREHFETARMEVLKGLRALIDARIQHFSKTRSKGEKIEVV